MTPYPEEQTERTDAPIIDTVLRSRNQVSGIGTVKLGLYLPMTWVRHLACWKGGMAYHDRQVHPTRRTVLEISPVIASRPLQSEDRSVLV
jgi:hypothetical protein